MSILLDAAYLTAAVLSSPFLAYKAVASEKFRTGHRERFGGPPPREGNAPCAWLHAVSVGEMTLIRPLVAALAQRCPQWDLLLSTATPTGHTTAAKLYPERRVITYPFDFSWVVRKALRNIRPDLVVLVELEMWPNFLAAADRRGIPVAIVNGRISERSFGHYRLIRPLVASMLRHIHVLCVQNETYAERLEALGAPPDRLVVTGNLKFDSCPTAAPAGRDEALASEFGLGPAERVLVGGCTWPGEDEALLSAYQALRAQFPRLRLILAPRQAERFGPVEHLVRQAGLPCVRRTALGQGTQGEPDAVILLDTVGELARVYGLATVVFVGGSLIPHGGHNILEPSGLAKPVLFGPHTANFRDITDEFIAHSAARRVADPKELTDALRELLLNPQAAADLGARARQLVDHHQGATSRTLDALEPLLQSRQQKGSLSR